jgi:hypothetical protein
MAKRLQVTAPTVEVKPQNEEDLLGIYDEAPVQQEDYFGVGNEPYSETTQQFANLPVEVITPTQPVIKKYAAEPIKEFGQGVASLADTAWGVFPGAVNTLTYAAQRALQQSPERSAEIANRASSMIESPVGRLFGVTETPGYQKEASRKLFNYIGENIHKGADIVAKETGLPVKDVENIADSLTYAIAPEIGRRVGGVAKTGLGAVDEAITSQFEKRKAIQPEETISENEALLKKIGIQNIRKSAVDQDPKEATSQYLTAKAEKGLYGQGMTEQFTHEKESIGNHFNTIENELGGTIPRRGTQFEVTDKMDAGKVIRDAAEDALNKHNERTTQLYEKARTEHGDKPVELNKLNDFLKADENFTYTQEQNLQKGIQNFLKRQNLLDEKGNVKPMNIAQSESLRQFINSKYNYETKQIGGQLKGLIDEDVFSNVGGETFETARKHFQTGKEIYDNPKAMSDLLNVEGTNQKIPTEKILDKVTTLPESQFGHMINVFKDTGKTDAIKQIQTSLINRIKEAGQSAQGEPWNGKAAAKERARLSQKLKVAFEDNPEILERLDDGIKAGELISVDTRYPGAAVQTHQLRGKLGNLAVKGSTAIGAKVGGVPGAMAAEHVAEKISGKFYSSKQGKQLEKEIKYNKLSDIGK